MNNERHVKSLIRDAFQLSYDLRHMLDEAFDARGVVVKHDKVKDVRVLLDTLMRMLGTASTYVGRPASATDEGVAEGSDPFSNNHRKAPF